MPCALAADVFGDDVAVAWAEIARAEPGLLLGDEASAIRAAVPHRQREFAAGRIAARRAMGRELAVTMGADRAPVWPAGIQGSISHADHWAIALVGRSDQMLGVDLERDEPLPREVLDTVLTAAEQSRLGTEAEIWARVIFCAKECAYKAQYARSRQLFGFEVFEIFLDAANGRFQAEFQQDVAPFVQGQRLHGRFSRGGGYILTGIVA